MAEADNPLRAVLITGCSSGIGLCLAHGLRARGWRVFATARKPADVTMLVTEGFESLPLDVDSSDSIAVAVDEVLQRTGGRLTRSSTTPASDRPARSRIYRARAYAYSSRPAPSARGECSFGNGRR